jgi:hypothetical protein
MVDDHSCPEAGLPCRWLHRSARAPIPPEARSHKLHSEHRCCGSGDREAGGPGSCLAPRRRVAAAAGTIGRGTGKLTRTVLTLANAYAMIRRPAATAEIETKLG